MSKASWCYRVTKILTRKFMVERGSCKEKKKTPYYHNTSILFTQDISILKCSYVLKGVTYGRLWYQNNRCDVYFHGFGPVKLQNSMKTQRNDFYQLL